MEFAEKVMYGWFVGGASNLHRGGEKKRSEHEPSAFVAETLHYPASGISHFETFFSPQVLDPGHCAQHRFD